MTNTKYPVNPPADMTDEEFLELVLDEQQKALEADRQQRLHTLPPRQRSSVKFIIWVITLVLVFNTFALLLNMYSIPAIEFLKTSARLSTQEDIQQYKKAVVEVSTGTNKGTGFAISEDGYILTNAHVVDDALQLTVIFPDDGMHEAEVIATYPDIDTALLKVQAENVPHLTLAERNTASKKDAITFIGNPLYFTGIANEGTVLEPTVLTDWDKPVIMMQAPVYKGNSGSPVIDEEGLVVGIIFATLDTEAHGKVGLYVPIDYFYEK